jgi:adenine-specific DNA methylase
MAKKLIEMALPLEAINKPCPREKTQNVNEDRRC